MSSLVQIYVLVAVVVTLSLWSQGSLSKKSGLDKCSYGIIESCKPSLSNACDQSLKKALIDCSKREEIKECSNNLSLRTLFSLEFTSKLEISAEEIVSCYELPESLDKHLQCPFVWERKSHLVVVLVTAV